MTITTGTGRRLRGRWKTDWTDDWTDLERGSFGLVGPIVDGWNTLVGSASLEIYDAAASSRDDGAPSPPAIEEDHYVMLGDEDPSLGEDDPLRVRWLWVGVVASIAWVHHGRQLVGAEWRYANLRTLRLEGILSLLARITVGSAQVRLASGDFDRAYQVPAFNADGRPNRTDTAGASGLYSFDLARTTASSVPEWWTAKQAADRLLADHLTIDDATGAPVFPTWPAFVLDGQLACLELSDTWALAGRNLLEALAALIGLGRGVSFAAEFNPDSSPDAITIRVTSGFLWSTTITDRTGHSVEIPASDRLAQPLNLNDRRYLVSGNLIDRKRSYAINGTTRTTTTLRFKPSATTSAEGLARGWDAADDAQWGSYAADKPYVFRLFLLNREWSGIAYDGGTTGIATELNRTGAGLDGERRNNAAVGLNVDLCQLDGQLLYPEISGDYTGDPVALSTWATSDGPIPDDAPPDQVRVYGKSGTIWTELTRSVDCRIVTFPRPGILLGTTPEDGALVRGNSTTELAVTLTVIEPLPLRVSVEPATATTSVELTSACAFDRVAGGTIVALINGALVQTAGERIIRDDRLRAKAALDLLAPYLDRAGEIQITDRMEAHAVDHEWRPGSLLYQADIGLRNPTDTVTLKAIVTSRIWSYDQDSYGTTIQAEPLSLDPRAFL